MEDIKEFDLSNWCMNIENCSFDEIMKRTNTLTKAILPADNEKLWNIYRIMLHNRHDLLHYFITDMLGINFFNERLMSEIFKEYSNEKIMNKTPDIFFQRDLKYYLIDVSITKDIHKNQKLKEDKYLPIVEFLCSNGKECKFIHINMNLQQSNMEIELAKLEGLCVKDFDLSNYKKCIDSINDIIIVIGTKIDKDYFDCKKLQFINRKEEFDFGKTDDLAHRTMGRFKDFEIDHKSYDKFFEKNKENMENIYDESDICYDEDLFANDLKDIIENLEDNELNYLKDKVLVGNDFIQFKEKINNMVNGMEKYKSCKPTHHVMVNLDDCEGFIANKENKISEQDNILTFISEFMDDYRKIDGKMNKIILVHDILAVTNKLFEENDLLKNNHRIFKDGLSILADELSGQKHTKEAIKVFKALSIRRKPNLTDLVPLNLDYLKNNRDDIMENLSTKYKIPSYFKHGDGLKIYIDHLTDVDRKVCPSFYNINYVREKNTIKIPQISLSAEAKYHMKKNGIGVKLEDKNYKPETKRKTIDFSKVKEMEEFISTLKENTSKKYDFKENEYLYNIYGADHPTAIMLKTQMVEEYKHIYKKITNTTAFYYSRIMQIIYREMYHHTQMKNPQDTYTFISGGLKNTLIIMANCYVAERKTIGKPFLCIVKTKHPEKYNEVFGKIYKYRIMNSDYYYIITNWRRLSLTKLTYLCDTHTSVLTSTMNSALSNPRCSDYCDEKIIDTYVLRTIIGYNTTQKNSEFLMDNRYAYMSVFSLYTNIQKLLIEKFKPPYTNAFQTWFIDRIFNRYGLIFDSMKNNGVILSDVVLLHNKRDPSKTGGVIDLPSFWFETRITNVFELLDEIFVYVHTMKEPTSIYHESVKALKTIIEFQTEFDKLDKKFKTGNICCKTDLINYLKLQNKIGFSKPIIMNSVRHTISIENPNFPKIIDAVNSEPIGELISTKAVIADIDREVKTDKENKKSKKQVIKELKMKKDFEMIEKLTHNEELFIKHLYETNTIRYNKTRSRQKVFETILDVVEKDPTITKTIHLANKHIIEGGKTLADICIKSQYGSKREFYVINIDAKATARITELFFRKLAENSPNEAISIPGDKKILKMQDMIDKVSHNFSKSNQKMLFINGDCTKWSAAETMGSFLSMVDALRTNIGTGCYKHLKATYLSWGMKKIQIPLDIVNHVIPTKKYNTDFLEKAKYDNYKLKSTQNFLQGMFNYSSSYKAVCCMNYLSKIWKKMYPESRVVFEHMEHSDDYVIILIYSTEREVELFRVAQKIMMRLHGYNDSDRKTSCQPFFMEFVSLISFNGVMLYPQIKKSKECNLNLPCIGYKQDIDAVLSRVKECSRVGCNQTFLYFLQKMHVYHVAKTYSILPGMKNSLDRSYDNLCNTPIELFGMPDPLPLFSLYCKGNINNYRLYEYGGEYSRKILYYLYKLTCEIDDLDGDSMELKEYGHSLHTPKCVYTVNTKTIKKLRKSLNITPDQVKEFWEENITYHIIKPKNVQKLIPWLKCMFFNRTFIEAYSKQSRAIMTMRLSKVVNGRCFKDTDSIKSMVDDTCHYMKNSYTLSEYLMKHITQLKNEKMIDLECFFRNNEDKKVKNLFMKILLNSDVTPTFIYSLLGTITKYDIRYFKTNNIVQVATQTPHRLKTMNIVNTPGIILQYLYNYKNYIQDNREPLSPESIDKDIEIVTQRLLSNNKAQRGSNLKVMELLALFNDITLAMDKRIVTFCYDRGEKKIEDVIFDILKFNMYPNKIMNVQTNGIINVYDPYTNILLYTRGNNTTTDFLSQCIDNIFLLFIFFVNQRNISIAGFKNIMEKIKFTVVNRYDNNILKEYQKCTYIDLFNKITPQYYKTYNYSLNQRKIIAFLKSVMIGENDLLDDLVESQYVFSYRYIKTSNLLQDKYVGYTEVACNYIGTEFIVCYNNEILNTPIILSTTFFKNTIFEVYNIGLRLTQNLNDEKIEESIMQNRLKKVPLQSILMIVPKGYIDDNDYIMIECQGEVSYKKIYKIKHLDIEVYPVFSSKKTYPKYFKSKHKVIKSVYRTNIETLSVWHDDKKLFTVPYWDVGQHDNMEWFGRECVFDVHMPTLLKNKTIQKYLFEGYVCGSYKSTIEEKNLANTLLQRIKYDKVYKTKFEEIKDYYIKKSKETKIPNKVLQGIFCQKESNKLISQNMRYLPNKDKNKTSETLAHIKEKIQNFNLKTKKLNEIPFKKRLTKEEILINEKTKEYRVQIGKLPEKNNMFFLEVKHMKYPLYYLTETIRFFEKNNQMCLLHETILDYCEKYIPEAWWVYATTNIELRLDLFKDYVTKKLLKENKTRITNNLMIYDLKTKMKITDFNFLWENTQTRYEIEELSILEDSDIFNKLSTSFVEPDENDPIDVREELHFEFNINEQDLIDDEVEGFKGFLFETDNDDIKNIQRGFQITANNIFVNTPNHTESIAEKSKQYKNYKNKKGDGIIRNNLLKRIYSLPDINLLKHTEILKNYKNNYNFYEFANIISYCLDTINYKTIYNHDDITNEILIIYHLLCNSFINNGFKLEDEEKVCKYIYNGESFVPCFGLEFDLSDREAREEIVCCQENDEIVDVTIKKGENNVILWIETGWENLLDMYDFNIKQNNGEIFQKIIKTYEYFKKKKDREKRNIKNKKTIMAKYRKSKESEKKDDNNQNDNPEREYKSSMFKNEGETSKYDDADIDDLDALLDD